MRQAPAKSAFGAVFVVALVSGCGGGGGGNANSTAVPAATTTHHDMTTQSTPSTEELAQTYLRIVNPGNAEADRFNAKAARWNDQTTGEQAAKDAQPLIAGIQKADRELLRIDWPAPIAADIKELIRVQGALIGDLRGLENVNAFSAGSWSNQFSQDVGKLTAAANIVRADLGLPPNKS